MPIAPEDTEITIPQLTADPYAVYKRLRAEAPVLRVASVGRTMLTKAADTRMVKENPKLFSSDDPNTPMQRAFQAQTLMRRDGMDHKRLRDAMMPAFAPRVIRDHWVPMYRDIARDYVSRLPRGAVVDLFTALAAPVASRSLAVLLGMPKASDADMARWSQTLIDGAGNFGWRDAPFAASDTANLEINACLEDAAAHLRKNPDPSVLSAMLHAEDPIGWDHMLSNIKIAIGGGINEPRDALMTCVYGLLTNPDQKEVVVADGLWTQAFEEAIRWVAPIQVSSRLVTEDTEIRGFDIPKGDTVMTIQASACHDEDLYDRGDLFNVFRAKAPHQAFGNGPHFCMGTHIARRQVADIALPLLFDRFPAMELAGEVDFTGFGFRGPAQLPVRLI